MAYRAYRPSSANPRPSKKHLSHKTCSPVDLALNFDPWTSMYKQNFGGERQEGLMAGVNDKKANKENVRNSLTVAGGFSKPPVTNRPASGQKSRPSLCEASRNPSEAEAMADKSVMQGRGVARPVTKKENNFFDKCIQKVTSKKLLESRNEVEKPPSAVADQGPKVAVVSQKDNGLGTSGMANAGPVASKASRPQSAAMGRANTPSATAHTTLSLKGTDALLTEFPGLKIANSATPFQNVFGQPEEWLDVRDKMNPPVHSRAIAYNPKDFLRANVKVLVGSPNEYYPFLTGVCLCKQCTCGNCKCVHFKYKVGQNSFSTLLPGMEDFTTEYKTEFGPKKALNVQRRVPPNELTCVPFKIQSDTVNSSAFRSPPDDSQLNNIPFMLRSKINNLGPTVCYLPCSLDGLSSYKRDYPDWKCAMPGKLPHFNPATVGKNMPFMGKPGNRDYGSFFAKGQTPEPVTACVPENRNNLFPTVSTDGYPNQTDYQRNYQPKDLGSDPLREFRPVDNMDFEVT